MKNRIVILFFFLFTPPFFAQDAPTKFIMKKRQFFLHYYPSALIAGDLALGIEYSLTKKISHEVSMNVKIMQTNFYEYNRGFRADYLLKWYVLNQERFAISTNLSFAYKDIYFENKEISYYYSSDNPKESNQVYEIILEDRRHHEYGIGLGISMNYMLYKRVFLGADMVLNASNYKITNHYKELIYRDLNSLVSDQITVPSTIVTKNSSPTLTPLLRFKISVLISK